MILYRDFICEFYRESCREFYSDDAVIRVVLGWWLFNIYPTTAIKTMKYVILYIRRLHVFEKFLSSSNPVNNIYSLFTAILCRKLKIFPNISSQMLGKIKRWFTKF